MLLLLCFTHFYYTLHISTLLLGKSIPHKTQKNNTVFHCHGTHAVKISLLKGFLHKCGRAGISSKQLKKIKQDKRMYATFPESQKNT